MATSRRVADAIEQERWEPAAQLVDYWMEEAKVPHDIYQVWFDGFVTWLTDQ